jgi:hypothetical protein
LIGGIDKGWTQTLDYLDQFVVTLVTTWGAGIVTSNVRRNTRSSINV